MHTKGERTHLKRLQQQHHRRIREPRPSPINARLRINRNVPNNPATTVTIIADINARWNISIVKKKGNISPGTIGEIASKIGVNKFINIEPMSGNKSFNPLRT